MTEAPVLGGEISDFSAGLCERLVTVSVCSMQINCIIIVPQPLYHTEEPAHTRQRTSPGMYFHEAAELPGSRVPHSALLGSGDAQTRLSCCAGGKKASCEAPGCAAVDCNTRVAFISKVSVLFHGRETSPFIDTQLYSARSAQALCNGFSSSQTRTSRKENNSQIFFCSRKSLSVSGFFNIKEEISRYPGSRPGYSLSSHCNQR